VKRLTRREFLVAGAAGAAGAALLAAGCSGGTQTGRLASPTPVDPAPGEPFADPQTLPLERVAPGVLAGALSVRSHDVTVAGERVRLLTYNGLFPGPLIQVKRGEALRLTLTSELEPSTEVNLLGHRRDRTNLHMHGLSVSPEDPGDNPFREVAAGDSWTYGYDLRHQPAGTLGWYHPHVHGVVAEQLWQGLAGPLIVEDDDPRLAVFETHIMVLKDFDFADGAPAPYTSPMEYMTGKQGALATVNGLRNPELRAAPGQVQRWRLVNASTSRFYHLRLEGHTLSVIGCDGGLLDKPYARSSVLLAPGERLDLLVPAARRTGRYKLLALPFSSGSALGSMMGGGMMETPPSALTTLLTVAVDGKPVSDIVPAVISEARRPAVELGGLPRRRFVLSMSMHGAGMSMIGGATINGRAYDDEPDSVTSRVRAAGDTYEVWTIVNENGMDHPWHQHVNSALPLSFEGADASYAELLTQAPAWKDTVIVPRNGSVTMLVRLSPWTGDTVYHCHIVEHEDLGMMGVWRLRGE
jgi:FtsP/CotA-like multicopper oxidase with cupredoxin domain